MPFGPFTASTTFKQISAISSASAAQIGLQFYEQIGDSPIAVAFGIPAGSGLAYSDPVTLGRALEGRQDL